jgi:hypothetical protein
MAQPKGDLDISIQRKIVPHIIMLFGTMQYLLETFLITLKIMDKFQVVIFIVPLV